MLNGAAVAVIGDLMLDKYVEGDVHRVSPEAPVPVVRVTRTRSAPGGAANVALGCAALECCTTCIGVVGDDECGTELAAHLAVCGVEYAPVVAVDRPTTVKWRVYARGQQMLRIDDERTDALAAETVATLRAQVHAWLERTAGGPRAIIISDYAKGTVTGPLVDDLARSCPVVIDPKGREVAKYPSGAVWKPNLAELAVLMGDVPLNGLAEVQKAAARLRTRSAAAAVCVTLGPEGMALVTDEGMTHLPTEATEVFDVTGAGDTVAAVLAAALAEGVALPEACVWANRAAAVAVRHRGAYAVSRAELMEALPGILRSAVV